MSDQAEVEALAVPLTPVQVEGKLRRLVTQLAQAQRWLRDERDAEVALKHAYERAHRAALLSADCPKVARGGYTTAERDAWAEEKCANEREAYEIQEARRKAADDLLRTVRDQAMIVMSLARSVNTAYAMAGEDR